MSPDEWAQNLAKTTAMEVVALLADHLQEPKLSLRPKEVAHHLGVSTRTVRDLIASGALPSVEVSPSRRVVSRYSLERFLEVPVD